LNLYLLSSMPPKRILFFFWMLLFTTPLIAQDDFGEELLSWVRHHANSTSREFTTDHWRLYWHNRFIVNHEKINHKSKQVDSALRVMVIESQNTAFRIDTVSIRDYVFLKKYFNSQLSNLYTIIGEIELMRHTLADQPESYEEFLMNGLAHHGRATLLESFSKLNNGAKDIEVAYGNTFANVVLTVLQQRQDGPTGNGSSTNGSASGDSDYEVTFNNPELEPKGDVERAVYGTASALMASSEGTSASGVVLTAAQAETAQTVGVVLMTAFSVYKYFKQKEFEKQMDMFRKAVNLLPSKLIPAEEAFSIYKGTYDSISRRYDNIRFQQKNYLLQIDTLSGQLLRHTFNTLSLCNSILQAEKIKKVSAEYFNKPELFESLFQHHRIIKCADDIYNYSKELKKLKLQSSTSSDVVMKARTQEIYRDALEESYHTFQWLKQLPGYLPLVPTIDDNLDFIESERNLSKDVTHAFQKPETNTLDHLITVNKSTVSKLKGKSKSIKQTFKNIDTDAPAEMQSEVAQLTFPDYENYTYYASGGPTFSATIEYHTRFLEGGHVNIDQSIYDGGFNTDSRSPKAEVDAFKNNLNSRLADMKNSVNTINQRSPQWTTANVAALTINTQSIAARRQGLAANIGQTSRLNERYVDQYRESLNDLLKNPVSKKSLQNYFSNNEISSGLFNTIPKHHLRPSGYSSAFFNAREHFYGSRSLEERERIHEAYKANEDFNAASKRLRENLAAQRPDPVFSSEDELRGATALARSFLLTADEITKTSNRFYQTDKNAAKKMAAKFVDNARMIRYYSLGLIPKYVFNEIDFFLSTDQIRNHLTANVHEYHSQCGPGSSLENSDCNRFTATYLKDVYGISDFYNKPDGQDEARRADGTLEAKYYNSGQIAEYAVTHWTELGGAKDQVALNMAGLLAGMGYAVIAVKPGHVCVILPTNPAEYFSSGWGVKVPYILNYGQTFDPNLNIKLNVPLSQAWSAAQAEPVRIFFKKQGDDY
jgi:hypothetical protein